VTSRYLSSSWCPNMAVHWQISGLKIPESVFWSQDKVLNLSNCYHWWLNEIVVISHSIRDALVPQEAGYSKGLPDSVLSTCQSLQDHQCHRYAYTPVHTSSLVYGIVNRQEAGYNKGLPDSVLWTCQSLQDHQCQISMRTSSLVYETVNRLHIAHCRWVVTTPVSYFRDRGLKFQPEEQLLWVSLLWFSLVLLGKHWDSSL
jgi:hypothetical protein